MADQVTIIPIRITKAGQQYSFQHRLLRTTGNIIGIETGVTVKSGLPALPMPFVSDFKRNTLLGRIQLQMAGVPNLCWCSEVFADDNNTGFGELPTAQGFVPFPPPPDPKDPTPTGKRFYGFHDCTHGTKKEEDPLHTCGGRVIGGIYRDTIGLQFTNPVHYRINLYVWTANNAK